jgi:hypothetical protein
MNIQIQSYVYKWISKSKYKFVYKWISKSEQKVTCINKYTNPNIKLFA